MIATNEAVDLLSTLFRGRENIRLVSVDTGQLRDDGKHEWDVTTEYKPIDFAAHFAGRVSQGLIIASEDHRAQLACLDIDHYGTAQLGEKSILAIHNRLSVIPGVRPRMTRSKSGGVHVWFFAAEPLDVSLLAAAMETGKRVIDPKRRLKIDLFPLDSTDDEGKTVAGKNAINLPFFGATRLGLLVRDGNLVSDVDLLTWFRATHLHRMDEEAFERLAEHRAGKSAKQSHDIGAAREPTDSQGRNDFLFRYGRSVRARGGTEEQVRELVLAKDREMFERQHPHWLRAGRPLQDDPRDARGLEATIRSICKVAPGHPETMSPDLDKIEGLNEHYAYVTLGEKPAIVRVREFRANGLDGDALMSMEAFHAEHANQFVTMGGKPITLSKAYMKSEARETYSGATFDADYDFDSERERFPKLNLFRGFATEPRPGDIGPWLGLLDHVANANEELARQIDHAFANMVQNPGKKKPTLAFMNYGPQGCGKTTVSWTLDRVMGNGLSYEVRSKKDLEDFTAHLIGRPLLRFEEAIFAKDQQIINLMKTMISSPQMAYHPKFKNKIVLPNPHLIYATTNDRHALAITHDDRRWTVWETKGAFEHWTSEGRAAQAALFGPYYQWIENGGAAALMHHWQSLSVDLDLISHPIRTEDFQRQAEQSMKPIEAWLVEVATEGRLPQDPSGRGISPIKAMKDDMARMLRAQGFSRQTVPFRIKDEIKPYVELTDSEVQADYHDPLEREEKVTDNGGTVLVPKLTRNMRALHFPPLAEMRRQLTGKLGIAEWPKTPTEWMGDFEADGELSTDQEKQLFAQLIAIEMERDEIRKRLGMGEGPSSSPI